MVKLLVQLLLTLSLQEAAAAGELETTPLSRLQSDLREALGIFQLMMLKIKEISN